MLTLLDLEGVFLLSLALGAAIGDDDLIAKQDSEQGNLRWKSKENSKV
jgi:hypothetical protein